ncbi:hypothetical protein ETB97_012250 [Aspergillus alliaceus]|uniref:AAA protein C-terminal winged helix domain-containing protein n=1 Tax=Petromyces alliaceus TaxID=209559 RepID=A0A8H6A5H8_PETAA|nr:hypothetical protein ETB97_012250 [Aspergillus burnettii]
MPRRAPLTKYELWLCLPRQHTLRRAGWRLPPVYVQAIQDSHSSRQDPDKKESIPRKFLEASVTAFTSLFILALGGYSYHIYYKNLVLRKIDNAFSSGYSTLELAALAQHGVGIDSSTSPTSDKHRFYVLRPEQAVIDGILSGNIRHNYYLLFGEKGAGKTTMLLESMRKVHGSGVAMLEAHGDLELFRLRLGKALDYEYHEDYMGSLFNYRGPREATPLLDIERALNKLEKVALQRRSKHNRPLVLIISNIHHLPDNPEGQHLLTLLQQRAELWAASELITLVFTSDQYRTTEQLRLHATRLQVLTVKDVPEDIAMKALREYRETKFGEPVSADILSQVYDKVGGRLIFLDQIAKSKNMLEMCHSICEKERKWLLSNCWILGSEMDPKAEDQQDYCAAAMILAQALVDIEKESAGGKSTPDLPGIPLHKAQELMTRADFIRKLDQVNIVSIDADSMVRADSVPMQNAFRTVCSDPQFTKHLETTIERLDELESLGRTRELTMKDLANNQYVATVDGMGNNQSTSIRFRKL